MNLINFPVTELSKMLLDGEISSVDLTRAYLERIDEVETGIKSYITIFESFAYKMAEEADRRLSTKENITPLTGIPIAIKDLICFKEFPTTCASKMLKNFIPPYNATVIERLIDAGAVFLGKTNMDEFAMGSSTENSRFFKTKNPWNTCRVPGGSSGGSAAAVAAKEAPLSLGSDTGGSIRQPAALCGITGLKPTYGAVSRYGLIAFASSLDQIGPMGRSSSEIAMLLDIIAGHDPLDSTSVKTEKPDYFSATENPDIKGLKIGIPAEFFGEGLNPKIKSLLDDARKVFEGLGAEVVEISLPSIEQALAAYYIIAPSEASSNLARYDGCRYGYRDPDDTDVETMNRKTRREGFGDEVLRRIMIGTYALSSGYYDAYYLKAQKIRTLIRRDFDAAFEKCDVIFTPATPDTAFKIGEKTDDPLSMYLSDIYTVSVNLAGLPGLVLPCGFADNLPAGLQLIGRAFDEATLLKAGAAYQTATDFHKKFPEVEKVEEKSEEIDILAYCEDIKPMAQAMAARATAILEEETKAYEVIAEHEVAKNKNSIEEMAGLARSDEESHAFAIMEAEIASSNPEEADEADIIEKVSQCLLDESKTPEECAKEFSDEFEQEYPAEENISAVKDDSGEKPETPEIIEPAAEKEEKNQEQSEVESSDLPAAETLSDNITEDIPAEVTIEEAEEEKAVEGKDENDINTGEGVSMESGAEKQEETESPVIAEALPATKDAIEEDEEQPADSKEPEVIQDNTDAPAMIIGDMISPFEKLEEPEQAGEKQEEIISVPEMPDVVSLPGIDELPQEVKATSTAAADQENTQPPVIEEMGELPAVPEIPDISDMEPAQEEEDAVKTSEAINDDKIPEISEMSE